MTTNTKSLADIPCINLFGVGKRVAELLQKCGIETVQDLLFHLPLRYQDRTRVSPINTLRIGDYAVIEGTIEHADLTIKRRPTLLLHLYDGQGSIVIRFFHFSSSQKNQLSEGTRIRCFGEVRFGSNGYEMVHPEYRRLLPNTTIPVEETLTPIYPTTNGLYQKVLQSLNAQAIQMLDNGFALDEFLPDTITEKFNFLPINDALKEVHRPFPDTPTHLLQDGLLPARKRLAFEELLAHRLSMHQLRTNVQHSSAPIIKYEGPLTQEFLSQFPFQLTKAQLKVSDEIKKDLKQKQPMMRLVQGDVGSGKTIVAALSMLDTIATGYQSALMAPTELLAEQHFNNFENWFSKLGKKVILLTGKCKGKARKEALQLLKENEAHIAIGTHALFQDGVEFAKCGLVIIDEQHRFGVHQRLALREKGGHEGLYPHQLIMTATPIPRTLAMTAYADLDISTIDELPPGRTPVKTVVAPENNRDVVIERIQQNCKQQRQAYWVCPLIDESETLQCQAAEKTKEHLSKQLPELRIGLIHGRIKQSEKEAIMNSFREHELDILVATTVIEVGVDVANASLMIIENAERLGLSQLHQLRGRVGRGATESHCVLLYQGPLSEHAKERLSTMRQTTDGFVIAQKDLELRGPGEILGTKQTGILQFRVADLRNDAHLLPTVNKAAETLVRQCPEVITDLIRRWSGTHDKYGIV